MDGRRCTHLESSPRRGSVQSSTDVGPGCVFKSLGLFTLYDTLFLLPPFFLTRSETPCSDLTPSTPSRRPDRHLSTFNFSSQNLLPHAWSEGVRVVDLKKHVTGCLILLPIQRNCYTHDVVEISLSRFFRVYKILLGHHYYLKSPVHTLP